MRELTDAASAAGVSFHPSIPTEKGRRRTAERIVMIENRLLQAVTMRLQ